MSHIGQEKGLLGGYMNYKFGSKELQETGMFDFGARFYMPELGRWDVIDPLAEQMRRYSPYNYAYNNPVTFTDPDGRKPMSPDMVESQWMFPTSLWSFFANGGGDGAELNAFIAQNNGMGAFQDLLTGTMGKKGGGGSVAFGQTQAFRNIMAYLAGGSPKFQFPKGKEDYYKDKYPAFYNLVKNQLPKIVGDKNFLNAFMDITGMNEEETRKAFTYGQGPTLHDWESTFSEGQYDYAMTKYKGDLNSISIEIDVLNWFEGANKDPNTIEGLTNLSYMTSLIGHEGSHWGNNIKGPGNLSILNKYKNLDGIPEHGRAFEFRMLQSIYPEARPGRGLDNGNYNNISNYLKEYVKKNYQILSNIYK